MKIEQLRQEHGRTGFRCGTAELDQYFRSQAGRDAARKLAAVFVLVLPENQVGGYYTLAPATVFLPDLLTGGERKTSRYPPMPAARLSRLAVDLKFRKEGYGMALLADALARVHFGRFAAAAVIAEAPEPEGQAFYAQAGFLPFPDRVDRLFRPMADIAALLRK